MTVPVSNIALTYSDSNVSYTGIGLNVSNTGAASNSTLLKLRVNGNTKFQIDMDGNMTAGGGSKQTIWIPARAMIPRLSNGATYSYAETASSNVVYQTLAFSNSSNQFAQFEILMPKSWNTSKNVTCKVVFSHTNATATSANVNWAVKALSEKDGDVYTNATWGGDTSLRYQISSISPNNILLTAESQNINIGGSPVSGNLVIFQVYRNVIGDTKNLQSSVRLHGTSIYYYTTQGTDD
jgi:hypothetical protein